MNEESNVVPIRKDAELTVADVQQLQVRQTLIATVKTQLIINESEFRGFLLSLLDKYGLDKNKKWEIKDNKLIEVQDGKTV